MRIQDNITKSRGKKADNRMSPQRVQIIGLLDNLHFNCRLGTAEEHLSVSEHYPD